MCLMTSPCTHGDSVLYFSTISPYAIGSTTLVAAINWSSEQVVFSMAAGTASGSSATATPDRAMAPATTAPKRQVAWRTELRTVMAAQDIPRSREGAN